MWKCLGAVALPLLYLLPAPALAGQAAAGTRTADEIRACSRANLPEQTMVQNMTLTSTDRAGKNKVIDASFFLKRFEPEETRGTLQVRAPLDVSGVSYLWIDTKDSDQLFLYLPSLQRVRRVTGKGATESLLGSDFSYEDVKHLRGVSAGGEVQKLADAEVAGRDVDVLQVTAVPGEQSAYERLKFYIDKPTCVPLKVEFFASGDTPGKRLSADVDSLRQIGERWVATRLTMRDLEQKTHTLMEITAIKFDEHVNAAVFNRRGFYLGAYIEQSQAFGTTLSAR